ncbi:MAG: hypothetical protein R6W68_01635 [Ignavibacteriaceae bacterium]
MANFIGFSPKDLNTVTNDVVAAKQLAQRCENALIYRPGGATLKMQKLLLDTFMIPLQDWESEKNWDKAGKLRMRFGSFGKRIDIITCAYLQNYQNKPGEMPQIAFYDPGKHNVINITPHYFINTTQKYRSATLIHEFIHMVQDKIGHSGNIQITFEGQIYLGIPFDLAYDNPYCYQYFAEWL